MATIRFGGAAMWLRAAALAALLAAPVLAGHAGHQGLDDHEQHHDGMKYHEYHEEKHHDDHHEEKYHHEYEEEDNHNIDAEIQTIEVFVTRYLEFGSCYNACPPQITGLAGSPADPNHPHPQPSDPEVTITLPICESEGHRGEHKDPKRDLPSARAATAPSSTTRRSILCT